MEKHIRAMRTPLFLIIIFLGCLFLIESPGGDMVGLMNNDACYHLLGCNSGFLGFDFLVHITSGIVLMCLMIWLIQNYQSFHIIHGSFKQKFFILIAIMALIGIVWELGEFAHDSYRIYMLHEDLRHPNTMDQPSNADTMGDMFANLCGGSLALLVGRAIKEDVV